MARHRVVRPERVLSTFLHTAAASRKEPLPERLLDFKYAERVGDPELTPAVLVSANEFRPLARTQFLAYVHQRKLGPESALLQFRYSPGLSNSKLLASFHFASQSFKAERVTLVHGEVTEPVPFIGTTYCEEMKRAGEQLRVALERNAGVRVTSLKLLFLLDQQRVLWLMGSTHCEVQTNEVGRASSALSGRLTQSVSSLATGRSGSVPRLSACAGDFCHLVLTEIKELRKQGEDYDDLVQKIRMTYKSDKFAEAVRFQMTMAADYLQQERAKLEAKRVWREVPFHFVLTGKQLLARLPPNSGTGLLEVDLDGFCQGSQLKLPQEDRVLLRTPDMQQAAAKNPARYYEPVKVCERCYRIYTHLQHLQRLQTKNRQSPRPRSRVASSDPDCYTSPLGTLRKASLDDLLADLRLALAEDDVRGPLRPKLMALYRQHTEEERKRRVKAGTMRLSKRNTLLPRALDEGDGDLAAQLFPAENTKALRDIDKTARDQKHYQTFLTRLRLSNEARDR